MIFIAASLSSVAGTIDSIPHTHSTLNNGSHTNTTQLTCDNWLYLSMGPAYVSLGDLDVSGDKITVEAVINRTTAYSGGTLYAGDIVSKHAGPSDANYLLRPNTAEITTTSGYYRTADICEIDLNKTYHVAMVYDGNTLKFYRNGFLMSQVNASGNLFQNNYDARIGLFNANDPAENFIGYINEVRIWNVARTQAEINTYMNTSLPSPATQTGLLAYYTFDNLQNKQGNTAWDGALSGAGFINRTNPACASFVADNCCPSIAATLSGTNICRGNPGLLTFNATNGKAPYSITYTDGINTYTKNNLQNGSTFNTPVAPIINTTYTLLSVTDASGCPPTQLLVTATIGVSDCSLCKGSLGDPIVNITFGSGNNPGQSLSTIVPGATTTMTYVQVTGNPATPTPIDGQYTITNNVPANSAWYQGGQDHTPGDVNGYMAFYNASADPGEFYRQTINGLCGGSTFEFAAWIANCLNPSRLSGAKPNITFRIELPDGTLLGTYNTGDIPQEYTFTWKQYGFFFNTPPGTNTVILKMINNTPGGNNNVGNDLAIDDITFRACGPTSQASFSNTGIVSTQQLCTGQPTTLYGSVSSGYASPAYLWQVSIDNESNWSDIPNSNTLQLNITPPIIPGTITYKYRLLVGDGNNINTVYCRVASSSITLTVINPQPDFSFEQDVCNPLSVKFSNETLNSVTATWNFGNGNTATGSPVNTTFTAYGDYTVQLSALTTSGCTVSITKQIPIHLLMDSLIITNDTTICYGTSKQLRALPALSYCWSPATSLSSTTIANPVTSTTSDITYYLTSRMEGNNLIVNGDFSAGNTGFISDYKYVPPPSVLEGEYYVGNNSQSWNMYLSNCRDHTTGNGNMLLVNGAAALDVKIWQQTVSVIPNTNYAFSTWIESISPSSPARLQFSINGQTIGNVISASLPVCNWSQFYTVWNSGNNTTATIAIVNKNNAITGNDFALDDISFAPVLIKRDSVVIKVEKPALTINKDTTICAGINLPLQVTGAATYSWSPVTGLSATNISNPIATPAATTKYYVTGTTVNGCLAKDSILVSVNPKPVITRTRDTLACDNAPLQLFATGGTAYQWTPALNLNNPNIANPVVTTISNTKYKVLVTDVNNCSNTDSVQVTVRARPVFTGPRDTTVCAGSPVTLRATGGETYTWSPQSDISNPAIPNPVVTPPVTTQYDVYISENVCHYNATLKALITVNPKPGISYKDTIPACKALQLLAQPNGHPVIITNWAWEFGDGTGFNNAVDITHSYEQAGTYKVMLYATDANGCKDTAGKSIRIDTVTARASAALSLTCPGNQVALTATGGTIYHWTPAQFLNNSSIATPVAILDSTRRLQVTVSNEIGCRDTASVLVNVLQRPTFIKPPDKDVCVGNSVQLTHSNNPGYDYQWSPATYLDDPTRRIPVSSPLANITYSLYVHEPLCSYDTTFNVVVNARPAPAVVAQKANDIDCMITLAPLTATGAQSYIWSPATHLDYPNRSNPVAAIDSTTKFYVTGTDAYGCSAIDSVIVKVSATGIPVFAIPNAFTPNNDGKNDCFGIRRWGNVKVKEFSIFNRWGQKVFSTTSPSGCWDGTFNGVPQATGGYVYVITAESFCGPIRRTGTVMLIR